MNDTPPLDRPRHLWRWIAIGVLFTGLAIAWRWTPLGDWLTHRRLAGWSRLLEPGWPRAMATVGAFAAGSLVMIPQTVLVLAAGLVFGPVRGALYSYGGTLLAAGITYAVGRLLGGQAVERIEGSTLDRIGTYLARRGIRTFFLLGLLPVAPFTLVNLAAGASRFRFRDFLLGTALGVGPGIAAVAVLGGELKLLIREPTTGRVALVAVLLLAVAALAFFGRRWIGRFSSDEEG